MPRRNIGQTMGGLDRKCAKDLHRGIVMEGAEEAILASRNDWAQVSSWRSYNDLIAGSSHERLIQFERPHCAHHGRIARYWKNDSGGIYRARRKGVHLRAQSRCV